MAISRKRVAAGRGAPKGRPASSRPPGVARSKSANVRKVGERYFDRDGKRISVDSARNRVERLERKLVREAGAKRPKPKARPEPEKKRKREREVVEPVQRRRPKPKARPEVEPEPKRRGRKPSSKKRKSPSDTLQKRRRKLRRDDRGLFISYEEFQRLSKEKRIQKQHEIQRRKEGEKARKKFNVPVKVNNDLLKELQDLRKKVLKSFPDLNGEAVGFSFGASFDGMLDIGGFPKALHFADGEMKLDEAIMEAAQRKILDVVLLIQDSLKSRRGLLVALTLQPAESLMLTYARDVPILTTRWMVASEPDDIKNLVMRTRRMLEGAWKNQWDVERIQVKFRYDHEVARKGHRTGDEE